MYIKPIKIQIDKPIRDIEAIQHDINSRKLLLQFMNLNKPIDLTDATVKIFAINEKRNEIFNNLNIENAKEGMASLILTDALLIEGVTIGQFKVYFNSGGILSTKQFKLLNGQDLSDMMATESTNEYKAFEEALIKLETLITTGTELNKGLETNVTEGTAIKKQLDTSIQTATIKNSELKATTETANSSNATLVRTTEQADAVKRELDQSIAVGDIADLVNRVTLLEKKGIKTLWSGSVQNKNDTITLSEDLNNFDSLLISYSFAGHTQGIADLKNQDGCKFITGNLLNDDSGKTYSILELELSKTSNTRLTITQNKELVNGTTVNLNVATINKVEGVKY